MLSNIKKMLVIIPCMILGLFLCSGVKAFAAGAVFLEPTNKVVVGEESMENTYYFTNHSSWEFQAKFNAVKDWDTFLKYRVVRPDGSATDWSGKQQYVNNGGKFSISDYTELSYTSSVNIAERNSIAPAGTYYVDIKYYGAYLGISWDQNKDETIKIIVSGNDDSLNTPAVAVSYDSTNSKYVVEAAVLKGNVEYGVITNVSYYFAGESKDNDTQSKFYANKANAATKGDLTFTPAGKINVKIDNPQNASDKYLYVIVETGNGYQKVVSYDIATGNTSSEAIKTTTDSNGDTGIFDYDFGELILLVLVVVLIVSCALIITQKIVDYKKRLY